MIRDYTTALARERGVGRRKSVEFDIPKMPKMNPPMPPPRPSLQQRQTMIEQSMYQNQAFSSSPNHQMSSSHHLMIDQRFQPTHRRSRPLSVLYKPPPIIMQEAERV